MNQEQKAVKQVSFFCIAGFCLLAFVFFTPNLAGDRGWSFFQTAQASNWRQLHDWPAAWCSLKIILFSLGLYLIIDATGTLLAFLKQKSLALSVFFLHAFSGFGIMAGSYYLVKALL